MRSAPRLPRKTPLAAAVERQHGMSLLEVSIGLAAAAALATAVFLIYRPSDVTAAVKQEQSNLQNLSSSVEQSYGLLGTFENVTQGRLLSDRLVPPSMLRSDGSLRTKWGGAVEVGPETVSSPNDAFAIAYPSVPQEACAQLASSVASGVYDIRIGGISVFAGGELSPATLATRCNTGSSANMIFVYHSGLVSGEAVAATPVTNPPPVVAPPSAPPVPPGAPVAPPTAPPVVVTPPIIVAPPPVVAPPVAPPVVGPPGTPGVTPPTAPPVGPPAVSPPYTQTCQSQLPTPNPATQTRAGAAQNQTLDCAVNQYGDIDQTRPTTENRVVTSACPGNEPWQDPTTSATAWSTATVGAWTTTSNTCTNCPAPATVVQNPNCAAGQYGLFRRQQTTSYNCPVGTRTLPAPTVGAWTTVTNTCTGCPGPVTDTQSQWVNRNVGCPSGYTGTRTMEYAQTRSRTGTTTCPAGTTTLPAPVYGGFGAWGDTGATRNDVNNCVAPPACASGPSSPPMQSPGGANVEWFIVCSSNMGTFSGSGRPDWAAIKAATPVNGVRVGTYGSSPYGSAWTCMSSNGSGVLLNPVVSGNQTSYYNITYAYSEVRWNSMLYTGWAGEYSSNADFCHLRGNTVLMGECTEGYGGSMPPGISMGQANNIPSTVHGYFGTYTCP